MGNIHSSVTNSFPYPLSSSCPRISLQVSSRVVGSFSVLPMALSIALKCSTVVSDVHTVSMCPVVSSHVLDVFTVHSLGVCLALTINRQPGSPVVSCSCFLELPGQDGDGFGEVGDGLALQHHCLYICCSRRYQVDEGIVRPIHLFYVVCSVVSSHSS